MNVLIGYGYHPVTTATYLQRALTRRAATTFVGTPWGAQPGFAASGEIAEIVADLPGAPDLYLHVDSGAAWYLPRGLTHLDCATACYLIDVHVHPALHLQKSMLFDYAFSAQRDFVAVLRAAGHPHAYWLPLACDPEIHRHHDVSVRYDIGFVGAAGRGYERRRALLAQLGRHYTLSEVEQQYTPTEMAEVYSASRVVFNCSLRHEVNMRVFEGPAAGTALLTDRIGNGLTELLVDGEHAVMYEDSEVVELAGRLLRDEPWRRRIARQGYEHVRAHHTYDHRVDQMLGIVFDARTGPHKAAPLRRRPEEEVRLAYATLYARQGRVDDTLTELASGPHSWRYRLAASRQVFYSLVRRVKHGGG